MNSRYIFFLTIMLVVSSCTYKIKEDGYKYNPYKENDTLIFKSKFGIYDTIVTSEVDTTFPKAGTFLYDYILYPDHNENFRVWTEHFSNGEKGWGDWLNITSSKNGVHIRFELVMSNAWFYNNLNPLSFSLSELDAKPRTNITTEGITYNDIIKITSTDTLFKHRQHSANAFYWSNEYGYVKVEMLNGDYWLLIDRKRKQ